LNIVNTGVNVMRPGFIIYGLLVLLLALALFPYALELAILVGASMFIYGILPHCVNYSESPNSIPQGENVKQYAYYDRKKQGSVNMLLMPYDII
ncbi:MAG: hypothetical protein ACP5OC_09050, partial [Thermoplasmata archaeon]